MLGPGLSRVLGFDSAASPWDTQEIIRAELFSIERLEQHAQSLARAQLVTPRPRIRRSFNARMRDNETVLLRSYRAIAAALDEGRSITPAAEWLIDNYHLVEEQIRQVRNDLPPRFSRQLPQLASGPFTGYPRILGMAWACIAHSDSCFDPETLRRFVRAYQRVQPLTIGELWAFAIMLRIVLVENLRRAAVRIVSSRVAREQADQVADGLLGVNGMDADPHALIRRHEQSASLSDAFVVQVVKRLRDQDPRVMPALMWLEDLLASQGTTSERMVHQEHQRQGAANVTVRNIITSMRLLSEVDWPDFVEAVSLIDEVLRSAGEFAHLDFTTRNLYRSAIEDLARGSAHSELDIARAAVAAAQAGHGESDRMRDPGYYLISRGRCALERSVRYRAPARQWPSRCNATIGPGGYIGTIFLIAALVLAAPLLMLVAHGIPGTPIAWLALLGIVPAMDVAVALVNRTVTKGFGATVLPALALRDGVPEHLRTIVVVPMLLTTVRALEAQIERLEVHYLASGNGAVHFALLSDWTDAPTADAEGDDALLDSAATGIAQLNRRHPAVGEGERFLLLHRSRVWSVGQQQWMGWERKRGKLHELNRLLRGATDTTFVPVGGQMPRVPSDVRYVVTLDADTRLPRGTVQRLVGKLAHPLNRPLIDATTGRIIDGYAVLQPRITPSLPIGREGSLFQRVFSSVAGIDPYDAAVSDVYQDLFGAGSYAGKGIYDVDAFEAALGGRVPEGSLLSHDLFEGTFARAGLVSDVEVVEDFPARYDVAAARAHRWARGDWQLLPWILGRGDAAHRRGGPLPLIGLWKMLDNLRRTLSAPACVLALLGGWLLPLQGALLWTTFVVMTIALPALLPVLAAFARRSQRITARSRARTLGHALRLAIVQIVLITAFLAHQAWLMTDAIGRTLFRLLVSRRNLLEWVTAAQVQHSARPGLAGVYRRMSGSVLIALAVVIVAGWSGGGGRWIATPFALLWILAPAIARRISASPAASARMSIAAVDGRALRLIARRTWRYFETFVTADDHMLPPDNFQESPRPVLAHRTSPTNLGLYLLSTVSAHDFGWAGRKETVERLEATLATMQRMQRYRGHFYNWYDTRDLRALEPRYVSSVDSGNLAAHLLTLANACRESIGTPIDDTVAVAGVDDALCLTRDALDQLPDDRFTQTVTHHQVDDALAALEGALHDPDMKAGDPAARLADMSALAATLDDDVRALAGEADNEAYDDLLYWAAATRRSIESWRSDFMDSDVARCALNQRLLAIETTARTTAEAMEFDFLLDRERQLLSIGYRAGEGILDPSCYDLLASEARLASFFAIAKNDVPARHWFRLGRAVTPIGHGAALISWSGSMFEYLMPSLVMRAPAGSLLEQTNGLIVQRQRGYGDSLHVPWGVSESAYSARDLELTYQYSNFGVPGLGLKRGLSENVVVAPYATGLAAMVDPNAAVRNYARLAELGARGRYGFYEAVDYTRSRLPEGLDFAIVRTFMAHHQGMTIVAIANVLLDGRMRTRFHAEPRVQATELLLQERMPREVSIAHPRAEEVKAAAGIIEAQIPEVRRLHTAHHAAPQTHLLSNGRYAVMLTAAGSGYSRLQDVAITRWREDPTRDDTGSYIFLRDAQRGTVWSAGFQPSGVAPDDYAVAFTEDRAEFVRRDGAITTTLEVIVSPEDDAEVRRVSIVNTGIETRDIDVTSYCEVVLATPAADSAHPAFSKLFVQTEYVEPVGALLATRRRRSATEAEIWAVHHVVVEGRAQREPEFETDRARFIGRGREIHAPLAMTGRSRLSNTVGTVLDPVFSLRRRVSVPAGATVRLAFWTGVADSRTGALDLIDKHHDANAFVRAATLAWTQAQVQLRHFGVTAEEADLFQRVAGHVLYAGASMRPPSAAITRDAGTPAALWAVGISGDIPLVLLKMDHIEDMAIVRQLLRAHEYWQLKQLPVDLVILNERAASYVQDLQLALETAVRTHRSGPPIGTAGGRGAVFVLRRDLISPETRAVLSSAARVVLVGQHGSLADQLERGTESASIAAVTPPDGRAEAGRFVPRQRDLEFCNGLGGFAADGREYVTRLDAGQSTPAPWINVVANRHFGFQVAVEGGGYTWSLNSRANQLTQWSNDPVTDRPGEVLYVRDEETGELWGPTAAPVRDDTAPYHVRHGQGYSRFQHDAHEIALDLLLYVPLDDPIKIFRLTIRNTSQRVRRLSVTAYVEWVLGTARGASAPFLVTQRDPATGAIFARNPWDADFGSRVAFADLGGRQTQWTADRREFLGRHGRLDRPAALAGRARLGQRCGAGLDPCAALRAPLELEPGEAFEMAFFLGEAASEIEARTLVTRYRSADLDAVFRAVEEHWDDVLGTVQVRTPDRSMDIMLNRWMLYQTLVCRMWARSAFYQASGAYGFRDQLQDGMALAVSRPAITREHLLRAAGRQFSQGDVQHWWLPSTGQGVRTRISDDRIWLAYAAAHYLRTTGDLTILDEEVGFIEGLELEPGQHDAFFQPAAAEESANFYEHCARGLDASLALGVHGLPLIGTGDWNDGMNRVGEQGRGESVWLAWFLHAALAAFAPVAAAREECARSGQWLGHAAALRESLEREAWDGAWYRRGYFDDGTAYGSAMNEECRIDSIAQSWSVIADAADPARAEQAMASVDELLIRRDEGLALLFTPPFERTALDPGYIKGYPPGLRENGGQYTHAAAWSVIAFAKLGQGDRATQLFSLLNPINHSRSRTGMRRYRVEPYAVAADVYSVVPHVGRGGWTWYTGSAGWLYRAGIEAILGFRLQGSHLLLAPCIPREWPQFEISFRYRSARYEIVVRNPDGVSSGVVHATVNGATLPDGIPRILLLDDGATHHVALTLGRAHRPPCHTGNECG